VKNGRYDFELVIEIVLRALSDPPA
jgi:hypothetical protein